MVRRTEPAPAKPAAKSGLNPFAPKPAAPKPAASKAAPKAEPAAETPVAS